MPRKRNLKSSLVCPECVAEMEAAKKKDVDTLDVESEDESSDTNSDGRIRPLRLLLQTVIPISGIVAYHSFALTVFHPVTGFDPSYRVLSHALMYQSHIGIGCYLFFRPHLRRLAPFHRVLFSTYGSVIFNFGSILFFASTRSILGSQVFNSFSRTVIGLSSAFTLFLVASEYIDYVDRLVLDFID